jgi:glycosyltransferase involved in cell wall biosynthesis
MDKPPLLSIITINFNNADGLKKTIESVVNQTYTDFEYIIIDGGSTDGSVSLIEQYQKHIACWVSEADRGIYHAMNKGIQRARGRYLQFLNSGDYLVSPTVTGQMLSGEPQCSFLYGNRLREIGEKLHVEKSYQGRQITLMDMCRSTFYHSTAYIHTSMFTKYGLYDEALKIVSDWKFFLIAIGLHNESVVYKDVDMVWFDSTGISSTDTQLDKYERMKVLEETLPPNILPDYKEFIRDGVIVRRLRQNKFTWIVVLTLYRILFRIDKYILKA